MNGRMPNFGSAAVEAQTVPKRKSVMPILPMAGTPETIRKAEMKMTKAIERMPKKNMSPCMNASTAAARGFLVFCILLLIRNEAARADTLAAGCVQ